MSYRYPPYQAKRVDKNQPAIVNTLRANGWTVRHTHMVGHGFPDLVACKEHVNVLIEVKSQGGKLNDNQKRFLSLWTGPVITVRSPKQAVDRCERLLASTPDEIAAAVRKRMAKYADILIREEAHARRQHLLNFKAT